MLIRRVNPPGGIVCSQKMVSVSFVTVSRHHGISVSEPVTSQSVCGICVANLSLCNSHVGISVLEELGVGVSVVLCRA